MPGCGVPRRLRVGGVAVVVASTGTGTGGPGGSVLDRVEQAPVKQKAKKLSPNYRVLLHNDNVNKREYVVRVLLKVVDGLTLEEAYDIMQEADAQARLSQSNA